MSFLHNKKNNKLCVLINHTCITESNIHGFSVAPQGQGEANPVITS